MTAQRSALVTGASSGIGQAIVADAPINRWVESDEIADATWFLHNNKACTGAILAVDGGIGLKAVLGNT
jgi:NAD(P)-dependent dehydrogenase (short-subunit alcohol dehydrogenase family)